MANENPKPKRGRGRTILIIIAALLACGIFGAIGSLFTDNGEKPETGRPADVVATELPAESTEPPAPTNTPAPTDTSEPISTARPVATAAPTEDAAGESAEMSAFQAAIVEISGLYKGGLDGLAAQSSAAGSTPALMLDDEWKSTTAIYLGAIRAANDLVRGLDPPEQFREVHGELLVAAEHFDTMTTLYAEGVDEISAGKLDGAAESLQLGNEAIQRATVLMNALNSP